jgi:NNP family nitrate/nitrite transporter-like MFS transporter
MSEKLNLLDFKEGKIRTLHFTWFAFFIAFFLWFNHAPLMASIQSAMGLSDQQVKALLILNIALTIPARIVVGMLVDKFGPRLMYSLLLFVSGLLCFLFAAADSYEKLALARFLLGFTGASFVIGIRMISEWFPARQVGVAQGIYGGWGNFGASAAAMTLPALALLFGGTDGWRHALYSTGAIVVLYSFWYYFAMRDTPKGSTYFKPKKTGAMEVTGKGDFFLYLIMNIPMYAALGVLAWKLSPANLGLLGNGPVYAIYAVLTAIYIVQALRAYQVNSHIFKQAVPEFERYEFRQVAVLNIAYFVAFGSELAVVSMLPLFFLSTFEQLSQVQAGLLAASFPLMNLFARPGGGYASDRFGRKKTLLIILAGIAVGFLLMSGIDSSWSIAMAAAVTVFCSFFVQAGAGAVFAVVPLIKRRLTGQIAGMTGAYGNVGGVTYLTVLSFVEPAVFFVFIGLSSIVAIAAIALFLREPKGRMAEVLPDGTVQMIEIS